MTGDVRFFHLYTGALATNTYVVINKSKGFVVDPGGDADMIYAILKKAKASLDAILLTHAHFDHIRGVAELLRLAKKDNADVSPAVFVHKDDAQNITSYKNLAQQFGTRVEEFVPDIVLKGGEELTVAGLKIKTIHTPGHTKGGICYVVGDKIFVGDTIFFTSYGRCDFVDGDIKTLKNSIINKLFSLKDNYTLLPGHGEPTTLEFERKNNPIRDVDGNEPTIVD